MNCKRIPCLIGLAGGSGSGKSTLAEAIRTKSDVACVVIEHDRYYRDLSHLAMADRAQVDFDSPAALDNELLCRHLGMLREGRHADVPCYDFATHTRVPGSRVLAPANVILLVGILTLADARIRELLDASVYVEAPACVRFIRRLVRDVQERGRTVESVVQQYLTTVRPAYLRHVEPSRSHADVTVSGEDLDASVLAAEKLIASRMHLQSEPRP